MCLKNWYSSVSNTTSSMENVNFKKLISNLDEKKYGEKGKKKKMEKNFYRTSRNTILLSIA